MGKRIALARTALEPIKDTKSEKLIEQYTLNETEPTFMITCIYLVLKAVSKATKKEINKMYLKITDNSNKCL